MRNVSRALSELEAAVAEFEDHYSTFAEKNQQFLPTCDRIPDELRVAIGKAEGGSDMKLSARIFEEQIAGILQATKSKEEVSKNSWTGRLANFLSKLYPVAKLSLGITTSISGVSTLCFSRFNRRPRTLYL
jgi:hypothetical protein